MDPTLPPVVLPLTANAVLVAVFSFFGIVLDIVPLTILCRVRNLPAITLVATIMTCVVWIFMNVCIWPRDDFSSWWNGHGLCDIIATLRTPMFTLQALAVCILTRDLSRAVDVDHPCLFENKVQRRRRIFIDVLYIFGLPIIQVPLHYLVQYNRYSIFPVAGCTDLLDNSWPQIVLLEIWPLLVGILNCYYGVLTIIRLRKHHGKLSSTLSRSSSGLDAGKFLKLFTMTIILLIIYLPFLVYFFYVNIDTSFIPYSFSRIHDPVIWNQIIYFHTADYPDFQYYVWLPISFAYILFFWYGFTYEAIECYRRILVFCGFTKIWPSLKYPREIRRNNSSSMDSRQSRSRIARINIFARTASYFDSKEEGQVSHEEHATTSTSSSELRSASGRKQSKSSTFTISTDPDSITPLSPIRHSAEKHPMPIVQEFEVPQPVIQHPPLHRGLFSAFRTHINVPFPLFSPSFTPSSTTSATTTQARRTSNNNIDLEKLTHADNTTQCAISTSSPVETNIWSGDEADDLDPNAPKMGTRAYREHERRKMLKRESREKKDGARVIPDDVHVNIGDSAQGGVEVRREFVRKEDNA